MASSVPLRPGEREVVESVYAIDRDTLTVEGIDHYYLYAKWKPSAGPDPRDEQQGVWEVIRETDGMDGHKETLAETPWAGDAAYRILLAWGEPIDRERARRLAGLPGHGITGWNIRCNKCGSYGAEWRFGLLPGYGAFCPTHTAQWNEEMRRHTAAKRDLMEVKFEQDRDRWPTSTPNPTSPPSS